MYGLQTLCCMTYGMHVPHMACIRKLCVVLHMHAMWDMHLQAMINVLQSNEPQNSQALKVELAGIQSVLGIESGGADALIALSLLCGGDYAIMGAEHVGSKSALKLLQHLLQDTEVTTLWAN